MEFVITPTTATAWTAQGHPTLSETPEEMPDVLRCGYASKRCDNPRTIKKSGGLHRFCAYHRERANRNQWRVDHRRRMLKKRCLTGAAVTGEPRRRCGSPRCPADLADEEAEAAAQARRVARRQADANHGSEAELAVLVDENEVCTTREAMLNAQDVAILSVLLFDDDALPPHGPSTLAHTSAHADVVTMDLHWVAPPSSVESTVASTTAAADSTCVVTVGSARGTRSLPALSH